MRYVKAREYISFTYFCILYLNYNIKTLVIRTRMVVIIIKYEN